MTDPDRTFTTAVEVAAWLGAEGWKVSKRTVQLHVRQGLLRRGANGLFEQKAAERYAKTHLPRKDTGRRVQEELDDLARTRQKEETRRIRLQADTAQKQLDILNGKYISRSDFEMEILSRTQVLEAGLSKLKTVIPPRVVEACGGSPALIGQVEAILSAEIDAVIEDYASAKEHTVEVDVEG